MAEQQRRLAAIVAMDVVGYSRLMGRDEHDTLDRLTEHRAVIDPIGLEHGGRIVGTAGDGVLVEFPSVVEAVNFALRCQAVMAERNADIPDEEKMLFRIGINLGDVIVQDDDLFGDGVNVAARIEALAEPGGIWVSRTVRDSIRDKLDIHLEDQGEVEVKNIARPVRAFRLSANSDVIAAIKPVGIVSSQTARAGGGNWKPTSAVAALVLVLILAGGGYWWWQQQANEIVAELPDKPSIAVLPFDNLSDDPQQEYFADGMAEDIITDLSKISRLFVIARNSSFSYKGKNIDIKTIGRELGVRYVLEGSVRRAGEQLRINAQLIDASTGGHMWAERYDGTLADVFDLQDKINARIIDALSVTLNTEEQLVATLHETDVPEAHDAFLNGWSLYLKRTPEDYAAALPLLEKAVELDPEYGRAWAALAWLYNEASERSWENHLEISVRRIPDLIKRAAANPTALIYQLIGAKAYGIDRAIVAFNSAEALEPNNPDTYLHKALKLDFYGEANSEAAILGARKSIRLNPLHSSQNLYVLGRAYYTSGRYEEAIETLKRGVARNPEDHLLYGFLIAAYVGAGRHDKAEQTLEELANVRRSMNEKPVWIEDFSWLYYYTSESFAKFKNHLLQAGVPNTINAGGFELASEDQLSEEEFRRTGSDARLQGYTKGGIWAQERYPDGVFRLYFNDAYTTDGHYWADGDKWIEQRDGEPKRICEIYRNREGNRELLDEYVAVCTHGVFPFSILPHVVSRN